MIQRLGDVWRRSRPLVRIIGAILAYLLIRLVVPQPWCTVLLAAALSAIAGYFTFRSLAARDRKFVSVTTLAAFVVRLVAIMLLQTVASSYLKTFNDATNYQTIGHLVASTWSTGHWPNLWDAFKIQAWGYYYLSGAFFFVLGSADWVLPLTNAIFGCLNGVLVFYLTKRWGGPRAARIALVLQLFFPSLLLWSVLSLKDTVVITLVLAGFLAILRFTDAESPAWGWLLVALAATYSVTPFRFYFGPFMLGAVGLVLLCAPKLSWPRRLVICTGFGLIAALLVGLYAVQSRYLTPLLSRVESHQQVLAVGAPTNPTPTNPTPTNPTPTNPTPTNPTPPSQPGQQEPPQAQKPSNASTEVPANVLAAAAAEERSHFSGGGSSFGNRPQSMIAYLPQGLANVFFAPYPWMKGSALLQLAKPESILLYLLYPLVLTGLVSFVRKHRSAWGWLAFIALTSVLYALVVGNAGTMYRYRGSIVTMVIPLAALGMTRKEQIRADATAEN